MKTQNYFYVVQRYRSGLGLKVTPLALAGLTVLGAITLFPGGGYRPLLAQAQTVDAATGKGYQLLSQGRINAAIEQFQEVIRQNPNDIEAQLGLGIAYRRAGRDQEALAVYQQVLTLDPDNALALSTLGLMGEFRSEWQPIGIEALTRLLEAEPENREARAQRAKLYFYQGLFSQSLADYGQVIPETSDVETLGTAAGAYTYSGDYATGLQLFERYRTLGGRFEGDTAIAYGQALRASGQVDLAVQVLQQALRQQPNFNAQHIRLRGALAIAYAANRQFQSALELLQPLQGRQDSRLTLARGLNAVGDYAQRSDYRGEAAVLYQQVLSSKANPTSGMLREASAVMANLPEFQPAALQITEELVRRQPTDASLLFQQLVLSYQTRRLQRPDFVNRVRSTFPQLPADPVQVRQMAQTLSRLDPPMAELLPLYQSLGATETAEAFLQFRMAQILTQQGQLAAAKNALSTYAQTPAGNNDGATVQLLLAEIEQRQGLAAQSAQRYQALINNAPTPAMRMAAIQGLAGLYQEQGRGRDAIALYDQLIAENPQNPDFPLGRVALAYQAGLISEAQANAQLQQILQQSPQLPYSSELVNLVTVLPPSGDRAGLYQQLLAIDASNPGLQLRALQVLAEMNPAAAQAQAQQLVAQNPQRLDGYFILGEIAQQLGNSDLAQQSYDAVLQQQPNNLDALLAKAGLAFQQGDYSEADRLYRQALALDGQNSTVRTSLAALNAVQGRPMEAIEQLQRWALRSSASNPEAAEQIQRIQEGLLQQRGIQPAWERF